jgi:hypothetical protein
MTMSRPDVSRGPDPCDHLVQVYGDDPHLVGVVAEFVHAGLERHEAAVLIATPTHVDLVTERLTTLGVDVPAALAAGRVLFLDAALTLAQLLVDGAPDRRRFQSVLQAALGHVRSSACRGVRAFGEMVDLLWHRSAEATLALEQLWNEAIREEKVSLLCAYRMDPFDRNVQPILRRVTHCHSHMLAMEHPARFAQAVSDAYAEVFGIGADIDTLRRLMVGSLSLTTAMSAALTRLKSQVRSLLRPPHPVAIR